MVNLLCASMPLYHHDNKIEVALSCLDVESGCIEWKEGNLMLFMEEGWRFWPKDFGEAEMAHALNKTAVKLVV